jgi:hypothetical protein
MAALQTGANPGDVNAGRNCLIMATIDPRREVLSARKAEVNAQSSGRSIERTNGSHVELDSPLRDREPNPEPAGGTLARRVNSVEGTKDGLQMVFWNTRAVVRYAHERT